MNKPAKETRDRKRSKDMTPKDGADAGGRCIRISHASWRRLRALAGPFTDTPGRVVARLLDFHDQHQD